MNSRIVSDDEFNLIERTLDIPKCVACQQVGHAWRIKIIPAPFHFKTVKDFLLQGNMVEVLTTLIPKKFLTFKFLLDRTLVTRESQCLHHIRFKFTVIG